MNSLELVNKLYKPYKITKLGNATLIECMDGKYIVKEKSKGNVKELFSYLHSRDFTAYPKLIDDSRSDINIYEYIEDAVCPPNQKADDLVKTLITLHTSTSFNKEVTEDKFKEIYENIKNNLLYYKNKYEQMVLNIEEEVFMSPSHYLFIRNSSKLISEIDFCLEKLDLWYEKVKNKKSIRISTIHNNLSLDHFLKGEKTALISWDKASIDSPILDFYQFYLHDWENVDFNTLLDKYIKILDEEEKDLLLIYLCMPLDIDFIEEEIKSCQTVSKKLDYVFKTEELVRPYYSVENKE